MGPLTEFIGIAAGLTRRFGRWIFLIRACFNPPNSRQGISIPPCDSCVPSFNLPFG